MSRQGTDTREIDREREIMINRNSYAHLKAMCKKLALKLQFSAPFRRGYQSESFVCDLYECIWLHFLSIVELTKLLLHKGVVGWCNGAG